MFIDDQPVCELEVTVQPRQGQAFRARLSRRVTYVEIPQYQPGELLPGVVLTHDGPEAAFVTDQVLYGEVEARVAGLTVPPAGSVRDDGTRRASFVGRGRRAGRGAQ